MKPFIAVPILFTTFIACTVSQGLDVPHGLSGELCKVNKTDTGDHVYGYCIPEVHFPSCDETKEFICYNRINRRDKFYEDKQPHYYIDPDRVLCYDVKMLDNDGRGCTSCTAGRFCLAENRCIMDAETYECAEWWNGVATEESV